MPYIGGASSDNYIGNVPTTGGITAGAAGADGAAGGTVTVTASGAITAGDPVGIKPDGTVSTITPYIDELGYVDISGGGAQSNYTMASDGAGTYLFTWRDAGNSNYVVAVAATYSGGTWTYGTRTVIVADAYRVYGKIIYDSTAGAFLLAHYDSYNAIYKAVAVTVSGTTVTAGSEVSLTASGNYFNYVWNHDLAHDPDSGKNCLVWPDSSSIMKTMLVSISGTTITTGTTYNVSGTAISPYYYASVCYDSTAQKFVFALLANSDVAKVVSASVSGTSFTWGTVLNIKDGTPSLAYAYYPDLVHDPVSNKTLFLYGTSYGNINGIILTLSGTTITYSKKTRINIIQGNKSIFGACYAGNGNIFVYIQDEGVNAGSVSPNFAKHRVVKIIDAEEIALGKLYHHYFPSQDVQVGGFSLLTQASDCGHITYDSTNNLVVASGRTAYTTSSTAYYAVYHDVIHTDSLHEQFVGLASETIADGSSGSITIVGGVNDQQSGLTAGATYTIGQSTGTLDRMTNDNLANSFAGETIKNGTLSALHWMESTRNITVGIAISDTKLAVTGVIG